MLKVQKQAKAIKKIQEVTLPNLRKQLAETTGIFKGKERKALEKQIQQTETELAEKPDKIPDILKQAQTALGGGQTELSAEAEKGIPRQGLIITT